MNIDEARAERQREEQEELDAWQDAEHYGADGYDRYRERVGHNRPPTQLALTGKDDDGPF